MDYIADNVIRKKGAVWQTEIYKEKGAALCRFPLLQSIPWLCHGFSTRFGGVSKGKHASMNLSFHRGDERESVMENYRRICGALGFTPQQLVFSDQTHTKNIRKVTAADKGKGIVKPIDYHDIDALITNEAGVVLTTFYADCVPIYLVDQEQKAIGLVHSGWRGTVQKISAKTIEAMHSAYQTQPENIVAVIGPSICRDCYEVSEDVIEEIKSAFSSQECDAFYQKNDRGRYQLDLWKMNEQILLNAGILKEHIQVTDLCTCCNPDLFFSHRASQGKRGNLAAFLAIR